MPPLFIVKEMTQTLGMCAKAVKWLNLDSLQPKQGIVMVLLFPFVAFEEALQVTWKEESVPDCICEEWVSGVPQSPPFFGGGGCSF